jgi:hypothetical protein
LTSAERQETTQPGHWKLISERQEYSEADILETTLITEHGQLLEGYLAALVLEGCGAAARDFPTGKIMSNTGT